MPGNVDLFVQSSVASGQKWKFCKQMKAFSKRFATEVRSKKFSILTKILEKSSIVKILNERRLLCKTKCLKNWWSDKNIFHKRKCSPRSVLNVNPCEMIDSLPRKPKPSKMSKIGDIDLLFQDLASSTLVILWKT